MTYISMARMRSLIPLYFLGYWAVLAQGTTPPLAMINGLTIPPEEAAALLPNEDFSSETAREKLVLFKLAVQAARHQGLEQTIPVKIETEKALYRAFLQQTLKTQQKSLEISQEELKTLYEKMPLIRLRHLFLPAKTESEKEKARTLLQTIRQKVLSGASFKSFVLKYSKDASRAWGGDTDFKGINAFPKPFYQAALHLKTGELSAIQETEEGCHLFEFIARQDFKEASFVYINLLRNQELARKESQVLNEALESLRREAKVEFVSSGSKSK